MKPLARFVIRPDSKGKGDLIIGAMFKAQDANLLKPGVVYQVEESMGELVIRPVGEPALGESPSKSYIPEVSWMNSADHILECSSGGYIMTRDEYKARKK